MRRMIYLLLISSIILYPSSFLRADGGAICVSEQTGNYRITVFTSPTPLRAGPVDVSVLVQAAATGELVSEARVTIDARQRGPFGAALQLPATKEAATNKLFYAATFDLPTPGRYLLEVSIDGPLGNAKVRCEVEAAEPLPRWRAVWPWVGWPLLAIILFCTHQVLVRRRALRHDNRL
jgi:hypothetical protein